MELIEGIAVDGRGYFVVPYKLMNLWSFINFFLGIGADMACVME